MSILALVLFIAFERNEKYDAILSQLEAYRQQEIRSTRLALQRRPPNAKELNARLTELRKPSVLVAPQIDPRSKPGTIGRLTQQLEVLKVLGHNRVLAWNPWLTSERVFIPLPRAPSQGMYITRGSDTEYEPFRGGLFELTGIPTEGLKPKSKITINQLAIFIEMEARDAGLNKNGDESLMYVIELIDEKQLWKYKADRASGHVPR